MATICDTLNGGWILEDQLKQPAALSVVMLLASLVSTTAQGNPQRLRFQRGHSSTTVSGRIVGFDKRLCDQCADQVMTVRLSSSNPSTYFVIYSINGRARDMNEATEWSDRLTESGDYVIRVFMMRSAPEEGVRWQVLP